jgi:hypothetical protein
MLGFPAEEINELRPVNGFGLRNRAHLSNWRPFQSGSYAAAQVLFFKKFGPVNTRSIKPSEPPKYHSR